MIRFTRGLIGNVSGATNNRRYMSAHGMKALSSVAQVFHVRHDQTLEIDKQKQHISDIVNTMSSTAKSVARNHVTGASISDGALSQEAHETIVIGLNLFRAKLVGAVNPDELIGKAGAGISKSGEGGEARDRDGTWSNSSCRQVGTSHFGVFKNYLANCEEIEIKGGQSAKAGDGGELRGTKVDIRIAGNRGAKPGTDLKSLETHPDTFSIEASKQKIRDLRSANPNARIIVKVVAGPGIGQIVAGLVKIGADGVNIAGRGGGTGAAPLNARESFATHWLPALVESVLTLKDQGLNTQLSVSGGIQTGKDVVMALLFGASRVEIGTASMVSVGCIKADVCQDNSCPTGVATQDPDKRKNFKGEPWHVANYFSKVAKEAGQLLQKYGFNDPQNAIGQAPFVLKSMDSHVNSLLEAMKQSKTRYEFLPQPPKDNGSSPIEHHVIEAIVNGKRNIDIKRSEEVNSFGARMGYYSVHNEKVRHALEDGVTVRFSNPPVQSFGHSGPPGLSLYAPSANDGTGNSSESKIFINGICANHTAYAMWEGGEIYATFMAERAGISNSGGIIVTQGVGNSGFSFSRKGTLVVLGSSEHYALPFKEAKWPIEGRDSLVGHTFLSGFTGDQVVLPKLLWDEVVNKKKVNQVDLDRFVVTSLSTEIADKLLGENGWIEKFTENITASPISNDLNHFLKVERDSLFKQFVIVKPKV